MEALIYQICEARKIYVARTINSQKISSQILQISQICFKKLIPILIFVHYICVISLAYDGEDEFNDEFDEFNEFAKYFCGINLPR